MKAHVFDWLKRLFSVDLSEDAAENKKRQKDDGFSSLIMPPADSAAHATGALRMGLIS